MQYIVHTASKVVSITSFDIANINEGAIVLYRSNILTNCNILYSLLSILFCKKIYYKQ